MERIKTLKYRGRRHLPLPSGPYTVGCVDIMTSHLKSGVFIRLFYPSGEKGVLERYLQWPQWIPHKQYINGYAARAGISPYLYRVFYKLFIGEVYIPAIWQASIAQDKENYPVIVFSHGLSGWRTAYSTVCLELVSHGFIVAAVEHRDYSASASFYKKQVRMSASGDYPGSCLQEFDMILNNPVESEWIDAVDGKWEPQPQAQSIGPHSLAKEWMLYRPICKDNEQLVRSKQLKQRAYECIEALDLLENLNQGKYVMNVLDDSLKLDMFRGCLDLTHAFVIGHSFGGATAILTLATDLRFKAGIFLDPWMLPFYEDQSSFSLISRPFLTLNMASFQTSKSLSVMKGLQNPDVEHKFFSMRKAQHRDICDVPFVSRNSCHFSSKLGFRIERFAALDVFTLLILQFLGKTIGIEFMSKNEKIESLKKKFLKEQLFEL